MTSKKRLVSVIISGLQWLVLSAFALAVAVTILLIGVLVDSCRSTGDPF